MAEHVGRDLGRQRGTGGFDRGRRRELPPCVRSRPRSTGRKGPRNADLRLSVSPASKHSAAGAIVVWRNARLRFQGKDGREDSDQPLRSFATPATLRRLGLATHLKDAAIDKDEFVIAGDAALPVALRIPEGMVSARLTVDVVLDVKRGAPGIVRCRISHGNVAGEREPGSRSASTLLADPASGLLAEWRRDVAEFARLLPEVSHREPAPSDRDPIPAPFNNAYNNPERNYFHNAIKYDRNDRFFVEHIADDETRRRLEEAWTDLLTSYEYHDANLRFVVKKFSVELGNRSVADLDQAAIDRLPAVPRRFVRHLADEFTLMQRALRQAEPRHLADALQFASRAWRRPLTHDELERLRGRSIPTYGGVVWTIRSASRRCWPAS